MSWIERQLPEGDEIFLDHVGFFVEDIEAIGSVLERLGFTPTPVNIHYNSDENGNLTKSGTANRLCTFKLGYIEVLGAVADTPLADQLKTALSRYCGLHLLAFAHQNMEAQRNRILAAGFDLQPTVRLRRPIQTPDGEKTVSATVVRVKPGVMSESRVQMLTHETPELIWLPDYSNHPNQAEALVDLFLISDEPEEKAGQYARFTGGHILLEDDAHVVSLLRGRMTFSSPDAALKILPGLKIPSLPFIAALSIRSADITKTRQYMQTQDIKPVSTKEGLVCIGPEEGLGAYLFFHAPGIDPVWNRISH